MTPARAGSANISARYLGDDDCLPSDAQLTRTVTTAPAVAAAATPSPTTAPTPPPARPARLTAPQLLAARLTTAGRAALAHRRRVRAAHAARYCVAWPTPLRPQPS